MNTVFIVFGPRYAGKTKYIKKCMEETPPCLRYSYREMLEMFNPSVWSTPLKALTRSSLFNLISTGLELGFDVYVEDIPNNEAVLSQIIEHSKDKAKIEFILIDCFLETAINRREKIQGKEVITIDQLKREHTTHKAFLSLPAVSRLVQDNNITQIYTRLDS